MRWEPLMFIAIITTLGVLATVIGVQNTRQRTRLLIGWCYLSGLSIILFTPLSFDGTALYVMPAGTGQVNLTRLYLHGSGFIENIILTIPLGWGIKRLFKRLPLLGVAILGLGIGAGIETLQYFMSQHWLINRSSDINDVIANATGILIGGIIAASYHLLTRHKKSTTERHLSRRATVAPAQSQK
ncbi:VanZ family protein [Lactiplantibacillus fabifermentans]|uniref:VanZ-like domain-containing protein n=2 Tax=Lactiplantibacillus fabifermentans TaxID=483011 RepID=A0A0R2NTS2_9LACO|nr:VanZ family protein [Lactiplantibacillus fabifermentans]ETY73046.1 membrane protein [Lactiplantibacillus fabifermentans T30PCM01]KRO29078.1 hypothetical protein DY78_GL001487 [Lactiplantibacillus fabifermentans DSM 21115]